MWHVGDDSGEASGNIWLDVHNRRWRAAGFSLAAGREVTPWYDSQGNVVSGPDALEWELPYLLVTRDSVFSDAVVEAAVRAAVLVAADGSGQFETIATCATCGELIQTRQLTERGELRRFDCSSNDFWFYPAARVVICDSSLSRLVIRARAA